MLRFALACTVVLGSLSSVSRADRAAPPPHHFAQPPGAVVATEPDPGEGELVLDREHIRAALATARARNIAAFEAYVRRGSFPSNTFTANLANVWRDRDGHLCAAATMIDASGAHGLVKQVAEQNNFMRLADVKQGPLMDWMLTSGLTQDEVALIQRPFRPVAAPTMPVEQPRRVAENVRLNALYAQIEKTLAANERTSLDAATERLMKHQQLAWTLLASAAI
jgi:hypothetical protein